LLAYVLLGWMYKEEQKRGGKAIDTGRKLGFLLLLLVLFVAYCR
jgi:hypothetical protein